MKTIMAVCGSGLGSSFMVEMNITDVLNELGISDYKASHNSLADAYSRSSRYICNRSRFRGKCISFTKFNSFKFIIR